MNLLRESNNTLRDENVQAHKRISELEEKIKALQAEYEPFKGISKQNCSKN